MAVEEKREEILLSHVTKAQEKINIKQNNNR